MIGRYNSVVSFVETNQLQEEANIMWGEDWEPCDDVHMIEQLLGKEFPNQYLVSFLENVKEDDILVTYYNGVNPEQVKSTTLKIMEGAFELGYLPDYESNHMFDLQDMIENKIKELLKLN